MNPREFIKLGQQIYKDNNYSEEPRFRTAINRIYFGVIHLLKNLKQLGLIDIERYHYEIVQKLKDKDIVLGTQVANLKKYREVADYYLNKEINKSEINQFLLFFERIIETLENEGLL